MTWCPAERAATTDNCITSIFELRSDFSGYECWFLTMDRRCSPPADHMEDVESQPLNNTEATYGSTISGGDNDAMDNTAASWSDDNINDELGGDDSEDEQILLDPDHPLMVRFQNALETQLRKRLAELEAEERQLNVKLVESRKERESLGTTLYSEQQDLALAQAKLDSLNESLQTYTARRLCREAEMDCLRKLYKSVAEKADESRRQANEMRKELDNLNLRLVYLTSSQRDVRSDVKVMKRAALETRQDLSAQELEKQRQDFRVDLLVELIDLKAEEINMFKAQQAAQMSETFKYKELLSEADLELEVLRTDVKQIHTNWRGTLHGMKKRDEALAIASRNLREAEQMLRSKQKEIDAFKKNILQSEERHEHLSYTLARINNDIASSKKAIAKSRRKFDESKIAYSQKSRILQSVEEVAMKANNDKVLCERELAVMQKQFEQGFRDRNALKEELVNQLQTHAACTKAAQYTRKTTLAIVQHIAILENQVSLDENAMASLDQSLIATRANISNNKETIVAVQGEIKEKMELVISYETSFNRNHNTIERKQNMMDECNKRLAAMLERREGNEVSPLENLALNLTKSLRKESNIMLDDQTMWVEKQHELLNLIKSKHDLDVDAKRQNQRILVLSGKKRKLDASIAKQEGEKKFYQVEMRHLRIEMEKLASLVYEKKEKKENMAVSSYLLETEFIRELKEMEINSLRLKERMEEIDVEKESLLNQLVHLETQTSWWQRKIQLGMEIKETLDPKKNSNADTNSMQCEIHRMTMRYQSLMKEQERLIRSMEDSVTRREYVISDYKAKVKRDPDVLTKSKCSRRIREAREKIVKFKKEIERMDEERRQLHAESTSIGVHLDKKKKALSAIRDDIANVELSVQRAINHKYKNLAELVRRQRKSVHFADLQGDKYKPLVRDKSRLELELEEEKRVMNELVKIVNKLSTQFPAVKLSLERVTFSYGFMFDEKR